MLYYRKMGQTYTLDRPDIDTISDMVDSVIQTDHRLEKQIKLYFCHRYSGLKLKEIGKYFDIGESGVSQTSLPEADRPLKIICPFDISNGLHYVGISGMSYHGGVIGVILVSIFFCQKYRINFWRFADLLCPAIPLGYIFGRLDNFINGELYGRITTQEKNR